jgi:DNA-binding Lrp family transcriptional regulator
MAVFWQPGQTLSDLERQVIMEAVKHCDGSKNKAAQMLDISYQTVLNKYEKWDAEAADQAKRDKADLDKRRSFQKIGDGDLLPSAIPTVPSPNAVKK